MRGKGKNKGMNGKVGRKGYLYTLEVLIAASVIFVAIVYSFRSPLPKPETQLPLMKEIGFEALEYLDNNGVLRPYVWDNSEKDIESALKDILPSNMKFETEICTTQSSCGTRNVPKDKEVIVIDYYVATCINCVSSNSYRSNYDFNRVRMFIWEGS